jgi:hypothetical protein
LGTATPPDVFVKQWSRVPSPPARTTIHGLLLPERIGAIWFMRAAAGLAWAPVRFAVELQDETPDRDHL